MLDLMLLSHLVNLATKHSYLRQTTHNELLFGEFKSIRNTLQGMPPMKSNSSVGEWTASNPSRYKSGGQ